VRLAPPIKADLPGKTEIPGGRRQFKVYTSKTFETDLHVKIMSFLTLGLSLLFAKKVLHSYEIIKDTTYQFVPDRDSKYLDATINQPDRKVQAAVRKGKIVYMIVGLKVSHKATVIHRTNDSKGFEGTTEVPVDSNGNQVGGKMKSAKESQMRDNQENLEHDFVYAYRLKKCVRIGKGYIIRDKLEKAPGELYNAGSVSSASTQIESLCHDTTLTDD